MQINQRVMIMREAITKIVPMLTQKSVQVTLRGMKAFVGFDPKTHEPIRVNLPYLPDDASDGLIDAVQGFLDHEVGHILFSDPAEIARANKENKTVAFLHNAIEDPMVAEKNMQERFTGSRYNLSNVADFFLQSRVAPKLKAAQLDGNEKQITAVLMVPAIRAWAGQPEFVDFMSDKWHLVDEWAKSMGQDLIDAVPKCKGSTDACDLAIKMFDRIGEEPPPPPPPKDESPPPPEEDEPQPEEDEPSPPPEEGEPEEGEPEEGEPEEGEPGTTGNPEPTMNSEMRDEMIAAINDQKDFDESVAEALSERAEQECANTEYLIFTRDDDVIEPMPTDARSIAGIPGMQAQVDEMLGPLASKIERMVSARSAAVWTGGHRRGRLDGASLSRVLFGRNDAFRRKQVNLTKNVAVELLVDCSGSMCVDNKIETASFSAYGIASILDRLNIANEVIGFTTKRHSHQVSQDLKADPKFKEYCRHEALYMPVFKAFNERVTAESRARFVKATISQSLCQSNVDGECVLIASRRLAARKEARKILLVLSDGCPAVAGGGNLEVHLKAVVKQIEASGTDVVGIGIMDNSVRRFYSKNVVMKSVKDLPQVVVGKLMDLLVK